MSDIRGKGYGDKHDWEYRCTTPRKVSIYRCRKCGRGFGHAYDEVPDIFEAMKEFGVEEECLVIAKATGE